MIFALPTSTIHFFLCLVSLFTLYICVYISQGFFVFFAKLSKLDYEDELLVSSVTALK